MHLEWAFVGSIFSIAACFIEVFGWSHEVSYANVNKNILFVMCSFYYSFTGSPIRNSGIIYYNYIWFKFKMIKKKKKKPLNNNKKLPMLPCRPNFLLNARKELYLSLQFNSWLPFAFLLPPIRKYVQQSKTYRTFSAKNSVWQGMSWHYGGWGRREKDNTKGNSPKQRYKWLKKVVACLHFHVANIWKHSWKELQG